MTHTVKVRIAVGVDSLGDWTACGGLRMRDKDARDFAVEVLEDDARFFWLTAELPVPQVEEIAATVEE